jgi:pimeloyl-ACP methyl ester carboxylesterase
MAHCEATVRLRLERRGQLIWLTAICLALEKEEVIMSHLLRVGATLAVAVVLAGCGHREEQEPRPQPPSGAVAGDFDVVPCVHVAREVEYPAECGTLIVPENRDDETSRLIALPVKRIPASGNAPNEPIFYLTGGPGKSNMDYGRVEWFRENHDIVLVGFRGVDGTVHLSCPEVTEAMGSGLPLMSPEGMTAQSEAYAACAERLTAEGIDLDGYTVLEVVDDVEAVRRALGYERINLESGSYGTRLAQIYTWRYPERAHRNAMVAVNPPGRFWWDGAILEEQLLRYSALCAENEYCSSRTNDLAASIHKALDNMPQRWLVFPVDSDAVLFATFMGLYSTDGAASTFDVWLAAAEGDYSGMALVSVALTSMLPTDMAWGDSASKACSVDYDFDPTADYVAEVTPGPHLIGSPGSSMGWASAAVWPANKIPDEYRTAQPSSVETLMLSGTLDVSTPAQNARNQLLPLLENGEQVVLADFAHTGDLYYLQREATRHLLKTFFATGEVDASLYQPNTVNFEPNWGFPLIAKLLLGGAALAVIIVLLLLRFFSRLVRQVLKRHQAGELPAG